MQFQQYPRHAQGKTQVYTKHFCYEMLQFSREFMPKALFMCKMYPTDLFFKRDRKVSFAADTNIKKVDKIVLIQFYKNYTQRHKFENDMYVFLQKKEISRRFCKYFAKCFLQNVASKRGQIRKF